jgi:hypothetical protein
MNDFLTSILAKFFDSFKLKNPKLAAVVITGLLTTIGFAEHGTAFGVFTLPEWAASGLQWVSTFLVAVIGSRTRDFITPSK